MLIRLHALLAKVDFLFTGIQRTRFLFPPHGKYFFSFNITTFVTPLPMWITPRCGVLPKFTPLEETEGFCHRQYTLRRVVYLWTDFMNRAKIIKLYLNNTAFWH